ncbi:hypothetical protein [Arthrobacter zhaoguopingii]|uniref:hypothetical protein n=1 Tax=Arthrobacter zhaoguopingii TaxID=2681491 RepID=UPI00135B7B3F|nr:hypothetical protein [Arthrobacter zhaoguopingii]
MSPRREHAEIANRSGTWSEETTPEREAARRVRGRRRQVVNVYVRPGERIVLTYDSRGRTAHATLNGVAIKGPNLRKRVGDVLYRMPKPATEDGAGSESSGS